MKLAETIFIIIHLLSVAGIVILLLTQAGKAKKALPKGLTRSQLSSPVWLSLEFEMPSIINILRNMRSTTTALSEPNSSY